ncbi:hypothetical protein PENTCL1PPCAC_5473 [Pristionchus entomophagus]|uniref:Uncharacterized protein n=1 Tax=Pristionchus entomophagus TaxID=358040 RepID=A0AAV5SJP7_9BILA|nr:hypothetical protein PENTCL1PPCAC_5473 [Pristionchus entomophagus]
MSHSIHYWWMTTFIRWRRHSPTMILSEFSRFKDVLGRFLSGNVSALKAASRVASVYSLSGAIGKKYGTLEFKLESLRVRLDDLRATEASGVTRVPPIRRLFTQEQAPANDRQT